MDLDKESKYTVIRFVAWNANHDYAHNGLSEENKVKAVKQFLKYGHVFITSEGELPNSLEKYRLKIPPEEIHQLLAQASLFFGESATMASEAAMLGTPAIYLDDEGRGYTDELEQRYGLVFNYSESNVDQERSIKKGVELLNKGKAIFQQKRNKMITEKINITMMLHWFISNYPTSKRILKENPDYQYNFK